MATVMRYRQEEVHKVSADSNFRNSSRAVEYQKGRRHKQGMS